MSWAVINEQKVVTVSVRSLKGTREHKIIMIGPGHLMADFPKRVTKRMSIHVGEHGMVQM